MIGRSWPLLSLQSCPLEEGPVPGLRAETGMFAEIALQVCRASGCRGLSGHSSCPGLPRCHADPTPPLASGCWFLPRSGNAGDTEWGQRRPLSKPVLSCCRHLRLWVAEEPGPRGFLQCGTVCVCYSSGSPLSQSQCPDWIPRGWDGLSRTSRAAAEGVLLSAEAGLPLAGS